MNPETPNPFLQPAPGDMPSVPSQLPIQPGNASEADPYAEEEPTPHYVAVDGGTSGLAIASLVCGCIALPLFCLHALILPLALGAIVCGHMALSKIKGSNGTIGGRGMAIGGLATGYIALLAALAMLTFVILIATGVIEAPQPAQ